MIYCVKLLHRHLLIQDVPLVEITLDPQSVHEVTPFVTLQVTQPGITKLQSEIYKGILVILTVPSIQGLCS